MSDETLPAAVMVVDASGKMTLHVIPEDAAEPLREALGFQSWQVDGSAVQGQHQLLDSLDAISAVRKEMLKTSKGSNA